MHSTVNNVIKFINENVESAMTVEEIAKKFNVSTSHLSGYPGKILVLRL